MMIAGDLAALTFGAARARPATALVRMKSRRFIFFMGSSNYLESARRGATCELMRKRRNSITRSDKWQRLALDMRRRTVPINAAAPYSVKGTLPPFQSPPEKAEYVNLVPGLQE